MNPSPAPATIALPSAHVVDRDQLLRLIADSLDQLGLPTSARAVLTESHILSSSDAAVALLEQAIDARDWAVAVDRLQQLPFAHSEKLVRARLILLQEHYADLLGANEIESALSLLQSKLVSTCQTVGGDDVTELATLLACAEPEALKIRLNALRKTQCERWGASFAVKAFVFDCLSPELRCPPGRLLELLSQALQTQIAGRALAAPLQLPLYEDFDQMEQRRNLASIPGRLLASAPVSSQVWALALSPDEDRLAAGLADGSVVVFSLEDHGLVPLHSSPSSYAVTTLAWSRRGILACSCGPKRGVSSMSGALVKIWAQDLASHLSFSGATHEGSPCAVWLEGDQTIATAGPDGALALWSAGDASLVRSAFAKDRVLDLARNGDVLILACADGNLYLHRADNFALITHLPLAGPPIAISLAASRLAVCLSDRVAAFELFEARPNLVADFSIVRSRYVHRPAVDDVYVAFGNDKGEVVVHSLRAKTSADYVVRLEGHTGPVNVVLWGAKRRRMLISGSDDWSVKIWVV